MKYSSFVLWAHGVNGLGSSRVCLSLLKGYLKVSDVELRYSSKSILGTMLQECPIAKEDCKNKLMLNPLTIRPPSPILQLMTKIIYKPRIRTDQLLVVLDDYPFARIRNQAIYMHQSLILEPMTLMQRLKSILFSLLSAKSNFYIVQTYHMKEKFKLQHPGLASRVFVIEHDPVD
jgi:hypothetical protein